MVSVRLRGRPFDDAVTDMIEGVLAANRVPESDSPRVRELLLAALADALAEPAARAA